MHVELSFLTRFPKFANIARVEPSIAPRAEEPAEPPAAQAGEEWE